MSLKRRLEQLEAGKGQALGWRADPEFAARREEQFAKLFEHLKELRAQCELEDGVIPERESRGRDSIEEYCGLVERWRAENARSSY